MASTFFHMPKKSLNVENWYIIMRIMTADVAKWDSSTYLFINEENGKKM